MSKRVLIFAPFAYWDIHLQVDAIWGKALQLRGCEVLVLRCDRQYKRCIIDRAAENPPCEACHWIGERFFGGLGLPQRFMSDCLSGADLDEVAAWDAALEGQALSGASFRGLPLGALVGSSVLTFARTNIAGLDEPAQREPYWTFLTDAARTYLALSRAVADFRPDVIITFNARFYPQRMAYEVARANGITFFCHERGTMPDSFQFFRDTTVESLAPVKDLYRAWKDVPLSQDQLRQMEELFAQRRTGRLGNYPSFYSSGSRDADVLDQLNIPPDKPLIGVFTSSQDELLMNEECRDLDRQVDFLRNVAEYCRRHDVYCVVRHHPHIAGNLDVPETRHLIELYGQALQAPPNMRIIMPWETIRSYDLFPHLDCALAPFSTVALEMAVIGIEAGALADMPTALFGLDALRDLSYAEVARYLDRALRSRGQHPIERRQAYRYAYTVFVRRSVVLRSLGIRDHFHADVRLNGVEDLLPGVDPELDRLCAMVMEDAPLGVVPPDTLATADFAAEERFLADHPPRGRVRRAAGPPAEPAAGVLVLSHAGDGEPPSSRIWTRRSRYAGFAEVPLALDAADRSPRTLERIRTAVLSTPGSDLVVLNAPGVCFDESFLGEAVRLSTEGEGGEIGGVAVERLLLVNAEQLIPSAMFYRAASEDPGLLDQPVVVERLLATQAFRRDILLRLLDASANHLELGRAFMDWIVRPERFRTAPGTSLVIL